MPNPHNQAHSNQVYRRPPFKQCPQRSIKYPTMMEEMGKSSRPEIQPTRKELNTKEAAAKSVISKEGGERVLN